MASPWTILLVDDSPDDRAEAKACLLRGSTRPYVFLEAETGIEALALLVDDAWRRLDCIVADFSLPDMDAVELLEALPRDASVPDIPAVPVVVLTGSTAGDENKQVLRAGAQDFVGKAWLTPQSITRAVENAFERHSMAHERQRLLTELSEKQVAVRQLLDNERAARSEAERANRLKDEFLATLSHELRTPLTAILGWTHILTSGMAGPEKLAQGLQVIHRNARIQEQLVADLLDMSRIISGKLRLDFQPLNLPLVVEGAVEAIRQTAEAKDIRIQRIMESIDEPLYGDATRLQQVVWNLLSNAVKFTPLGGKVRVLVSRGEGGVEIAVSDSGKGIKPEFLPHVFERFRQADASATREHGGLGLGLAIVKQLVDLHGGRVRVDSAGEGLGATFTVELPVATATAQRAEGPRAPAMPSNEIRRRFDRRDLHGVRVLVVDDEPDTRDVIKRILEESEAEVSTAASAEEGFEQLLAMEPDVLVSDIGMPGQDGHEFIRRVRAAGKGTPAVALTAFARREDKERALLAGYQAHVAKPVVPAVLLATVASLTGSLEHEEPQDEQATR